jgi:hypothetical protein
VERGVLGDVSERGGAVMNAVDRFFRVFASLPSDEQHRIADLLDEDRDEEAFAIAGFEFVPERTVH